MRLVQLEIEAPGLRWGPGQIAPLCIVIGANESGKTSFLQAIDVALHGNGAPTEAWDRFAEGPSSVEVRFDAAQQRGCSSPRICRRVSARKQEPVTIDGHSYGVKAGDDLIEDFVGPCASFSIERFLAQNKREQIAQVSSWVPDPIGWDVAHVNESVLTEASRTVVDLTTMDAAWSRLGLDVSTDDKPRAYIDAAITLLRDADLAANRDALRLGKVVEQDFAETLRPDDLPSGTVATWRAKVAEIDQRTATLREQLGAAEATELAVRRAQDRLTRRATALDDADRTVRDRADAVLRCAGRATSLNAARDTTSVLLEQARADEAETRAQRAALATEERELESRLDRAGGLAAAAYLLRPDLLAARQIVDGLHRVAVAHIDAVLARLAEAEAAVDHASPVRSKLAEVKTNLEGISTQQAARVRTFERLRDEHERAVKTARHVEGELTQAKAAQATAQAVRDALTTETDEAQAEQLAEGSGDASALREALEALAVDRKEAVRIADLLSDHDGKQAARDQRRLDFSRAKERRTLARALVAAFVTVQAKMLELSVHPLLKPASEILHAAYGYDLELKLVDDSRSLLFTIRRPGGPAIPIEHASTSVRACIGVALRCAFLRAVGGSDWKALLIDNFEHIDIGKRNLLIQAILDQGVCDNVIVAAVSDGWVVPGEWPVVQLVPRTPGRVATLDGHVIGTWGSPHV